MPGDRLRSAWSGLFMACAILFWDSLMAQKDLILMIKKLVVNE